MKRPNGEAKLKERKTLLDEVNAQLLEEKKRLEEAQHKAAVATEVAFIKKEIDGLNEENVRALAQTFRLRQDESLESPRQLALTDLLLMVARLEEQMVGDPVLHELLRRWVTGGGYLRDCDIEGFENALIGRGHKAEAAKQKAATVYNWRARIVDAPIYAKALRDIHAVGDKPLESESESGHLSQEDVHQLAQEVSITAKSRDSVSMDRDLILRERFASDKLAESDRARIDALIEKVGALEDQKRTPAS